MKTIMSLLVLLTWVGLNPVQAKDFPDDLYPALNIESTLASIHPHSDDPFQYPSDFSPSKIEVSELSWITNKNLPDQIDPQRSNNNVSITVFENRLFMAFRTSTTHFASKKTKLFLMSSLNGKDWDFEAEIFKETDMREPQLVVMGNQLHFVFFEGGSNPFEFKPTVMLKLTRSGLGQWSEPVTFLEAGEVPWEMKSRRGYTYLTSYKGTHYSISKPSDIAVMFKKTLDGFHVTPADEAAESAVIYRGGVSEVGWEFDKDGNVWGVTRDEDGDRNGFGSQLMFASKDNLNDWKQLGETDPNCYMSPKMFRVGNDMYLIGRKQLGPKPFGRTDRGASISWQRINNWVSHSLTAKGTALYKINKVNHTIDFVMDLPGHGDTAFPSIYRLNEKEFLVANYSSALDKPGRSWIYGQLRPTEIYLMKLSFK